MCSTTWNVDEYSRNRASTSTYHKTVIIRETHERCHHESVPVDDPIGRAHVGKARAFRLEINESNNGQRTARLTAKNNVRAHRRVNSWTIHDARLLRRAYPIKSLHARLRFS